MLAVLIFIRKGFVPSDQTQLVFFENTNAILFFNTLKVPLTPIFTFKWYVAYVVFIHSVMRFV